MWARILSAALAIAGSGWSREFPVRYVRTIPAAKPELTGHDKAGKPWRVRFEAPGGGEGVARLLTADFDHDGQEDYLIDRGFHNNGWCSRFARVVVLLFDDAGRPVPWKVDTQAPYAILDTDGDQRAEFVSIGCASPFSNHPLGERWIDGIYAARDRKLIATRTSNLAAYRTYTGSIPARPAEWKDPRPALDSVPAGRLESFVKPAPSRPGESAEIVVSGRTAPGPSDVVVDSPAGREIDLDEAEQPILSALRDGSPVALLGSLLWIDASRGSRARVEVELEPLTIRKSETVAFRAEPNCDEFRTEPGEVRFLRCADGAWSRKYDTSADQLLPDRRTVRTTHTAMGHSVTFETRYERPPGAISLQSATGSLSQWSSPSGAHFSLHGADGALAAWKVAVPFRGLLISDREALVFAHPRAGGDVELTHVRGRFRWRRVE